MAASVQLDYDGPDWPLGFIAVVTPGVPVNIMSVVDSAGVNNPNAPQPPLPVGGIITLPAKVYSYTVRCQQIIFQALKPGAAHGTQGNTGNVYITRKGVQGAGNRDDTGSIVATLATGGTFTLASAPVNNNVFSPYRYSVDADNANDGVFVTLVIG